MSDLFEVVVGVFVKKRTNGVNKYLIVKRAPGVKAFPNLWVPPGGHLDVSDFANRPMDSGQCWSDVLVTAIDREIMEETDILVGPPRFIMSRAFIKNGVPVVILSFVADYLIGEITLKMDEVCEYRWVTLEEAKEYPMIDGVIEELGRVVEMEKAQVPQLTDEWYE